jgi:hypothetical protein
MPFKLKYNSRENTRFGDKHRLEDDFKMNLNEIRCESVWAGFIWLRIRSNGGIV